MKRIALAAVLALAGAIAGSGLAAPKIPASPASQDSTTAAGAATAPTARAAIAAPAGYAPGAALKLPAVWRWGSMTPDAQGALLYVPQLNKTTVLDTAGGKIVAEMSSSNSGACAVALDPDAGRGFISNSWLGSVTVFDLKTRAVLGAVDLGGKVYDAGPMIFDPASKRILVCRRNGPELVSFPADLDLKAGKISGPLRLDGDPQSLVADGQGMAYIALFGQEIEVLNTRSMKVAANWTIDAQGKFPGGLSGISMDRVRSRLFVGCQGGVAVLSAVDGHELARLPMNPGGITETAFYDGKVFARGGDGSLSVIAQKPDGTFELRETIRSPNLAGGAMALEPATGTLYLSARDDAPAAEPAGRGKPPAAGSAIQVLRPIAAP